jgi:hypothetical protein
VIETASYALGCVSALQAKVGAFAPTVKRNLEESFSQAKGLQEEYKQMSDSKMKSEESSGQKG